MVSKVDERRNIDEIAAGLGHGAFEVCKVIYGLLTSGVLALREDLRRLPLDRLQRMSAEDQARVAEQIYRFGQQLMAGQERGGQHDAGLRLFRAEMESGRGADAVLDRRRPPRLDLAPMAARADRTPAGRPLAAAPPGRRASRSPRRP